jgi:hypothetical protein
MNVQQMKEIEQYCLDNKLTFDSEEEADEVEYDGLTSPSLIKEQRDIKQIKDKYKIPLNTWIVKPGENTNRGNGIEVCSSMNDIKTVLRGSGYQSFII